MCLVIFWGRNSGKRYVDYAFVYCMMVAQRYVSSNGTVGLRSYFHFVKKWEKQDLPQRESMEKKNGLTGGTSSWVSQES